MIHWSLMPGTYIFCNLMIKHLQQNANVQVFKDVIVKPQNLHL